MHSNTFKALQIQESENQTYSCQTVERDMQDLPEGDVLIKVLYSSLNYKDALSASGNKGVTRNYPHTPGIDAAGIIEESHCENFTKGSHVLVTGYDLGMNTSGGLSEYIRVPADWVVHCPDPLSLRDSMIYGTAGFTAALSVDRLIQAGIRPDDGDILVTGATGGVGSLAISIMAHLGYDVYGCTGKPENEEFLESLGAKGILSRDELDDTSNKPMLKPRWSGVIDTVGGNMLATALKTTKYNGCVTCCGNIAGASFNSSVYPFILRGITLYGIDSVQCPMPLRQEIWNKLALTWKPDDLEKNVTEIDLEKVCDQFQKMLEGQSKGRILVNIGEHIL